MNENMIRTMDDVLTIIVLKTSFNEDTIYTGKPRPPRSPITVEVIVNETKTEFLMGNKNIQNEDS